jgi:hypothetical protein
MWVCLAAAVWACMDTFDRDLHALQTLLSAACLELLIIAECIGMHFCVGCLERHQVICMISATARVHAAPGSCVTGLTNAVAVNSLESLFNSQILADQWLRAWM